MGLPSLVLLHLSGEEHGTCLRCSTHLLEEGNSHLERNCLQISCLSQAQPRVEHANFYKHKQTQISRVNQPSPTQIIQSCRCIHCTCNKFFQNLFQFFETKNCFKPLSFEMVYYTAIDSSYTVQWILSTHKRVL